MAQFDIRVRSGEHEIREYPLETGEDFEEGEVVVVDTSSGEIEECGSDPAVVTGISATSSQNAVSNQGVTATLADNTLIGVYVPTDNTLFQVNVGGTLATGNRFATDGAGTAATPTAATAVGEEAGFILITDGTENVWVVDTGAANKHVLIEALYNSVGENIKQAGATSTTAAVMTFSFI
jgi:hypothetical protein